MKLTTLQAALGSALTLLSLPVCNASSHKHRHQFPDRHARLHVHQTNESNPIVKRGSCAFPTDDPNLVAITPDSDNAGWAMSPDQPCKPGHYCPIACKPGMVMAQWEPDSTYSYPASMNGGLFCDHDGAVNKPFPQKPHCVEGTGAIKAVNKCGKPMSWCQTVLPGNEAMLIPTVVSSEATLAVPDTSYWCETAAHFYINPPGTDAGDCVWGSPSIPVGNWSPYVAGANTDSNGRTFVKLGWNPIWQGSSLKSTLPSFGVKIECPDGGCNGLPCEIDPNPSGDVSSQESAVGAGNSIFCVVTVPKGQTAVIVAFESGSGGGGSGSDPDSSSSSDSAPSSSSAADLEAGNFAAQASKTPSAPPSRSTTTVVKTTATPTTSEETTTTIKAKKSTEASTAKSSTTESLSTSTQAATTAWTSKEDAAATTSSSWSSTTSATKRVRPSVKPEIFHQNGTSLDAKGTTTIVPESSQTLPESAPTAAETKGEAGRQQGSPAVAGLIVAFIAAACFF